MASYHEVPTPKMHRPQEHHQHQHSFIDELQQNVSSPLPDLCPPRDLCPSRDPYHHVTGSADDYFRSAAAGDDGRTCAGCMVPIRERHYLSAVGNSWHVSCLVCCECGQQLDRQSTCYVHDSRIYCRDDYFASVSQFRLFCCNTVLT